MGQSQLLMIILGVIIVGIAIAVGIGQFGESALAANRDAIARTATGLSPSRRPGTANRSVLGVVGIPSRD